MRTASRLTFEPSEERAPVWSADGKYLFYGTDRKGVPDIYLKRIDGSGDDHVVIEESGDQEPLDASSDGRYLLYSNSENFSETRHDIFYYSIADRRSFPFIQTPADERFARFSPDAAWVAYVDDAAGHLEVHVRRFPDGGIAQQVSAGGGVHPRWSPDGRTIYYRSKRTVLSVGIDAAGNLSEGRALFTYPEEIAGFEPLPDGRFLLGVVDEMRASPAARIIVRWPDSQTAK